MIYNCSQVERLKKYIRKKRGKKGNNFNTWNGQGETYKATCGVLHVVLFFWKIGMYRRHVNRGNHVF